MTRRGVWALCWLCCMGCAGTRGATTPVIVAGSICSGLAAIDPIQPAPDLHAAPEAALVAFVAESRANELAVYDIQAARLRFRVSQALHSRPQILRDVVVATDDHGQLLGFDLETGARRFGVPTARTSWLGAVQVGRLVIFTTTSLSFRPGERGSTVTAIDSHTGALAWERNVPYTLSRPSAVGERVFLISDHADVWELDARSGSPRGCARSTSEPVEWLAADASGLWLGASDARRLALPGNMAGSLALPLAALPGRPALQASSYEAVPAGRSAHGRVAVIDAFEPGAAAPHLLGDRYFFVFYRQLFAYRGDGQLSWARLLDADVARVHLAGPWLVLIDEDGWLQLLNADDGSARDRMRLATRLSSADVRAAQLTVAATSAETARPLRNALAEIASDTDARLLPGRLLAVAALAAQEDPAATSDLLHIYAQTGAPTALRDRIAALMPSRKLGTEYWLDALLEHYDFLEDRSSPPLAAIVPGLLAARETRAVPRLVDRLFDPETRLDELEGLVNAIAELGDQSASQPLAKFLAMYHADTAFAEQPAPLLAAARALLKRGGAQAELVQQLVQAPITLPGLRTSLSELAATPTPTSQAPASAAPLATAPLPAMLDDAAVKRTMAEHAEDLRVCILSELARNPSLRQVRLSFVVKKGGDFAGLQVLPDHPELQQCLKSRFAVLRFPAFESGRRLASYTVAVHSDAVTAALAQPTAAEQPFWKLAERRAGPWPALPAGPAWWQNQNPLFVTVDDTLTPNTAPATPAARAASPAPPPASRPPVEPAAQDKWWLPAGAP